MYNTDYQKKLRKSFDQLRKNRVLIPRDTCDKCRRHASEFSIPLELHHIIPIRECTEELGDFPNTPDNLATLCRRCHHGFHACYEDSYPDFKVWMSDIPTEEVWEKLAEYQHNKKQLRKQHMLKHRNNK